MTARASIDLPEPDSPTTQSVSPGATASDTSSTAKARSASRCNATLRRLIDRTGAVAIPYCLPQRNLRPPRKRRR